MQYRSDNLGWKTFFDLGKRDNWIIIKIQYMANVRTNKNLIFSLSDTTQKCFSSVFCEYYLVTSWSLLAGTRSGLFTIRVPVLRDSQNWEYADNAEKTWLYFFFTERWCICICICIWTFIISERWWANQKVFPVGEQVST